MNASTQIPIRRLTFGFGAGALSTALLLLAATAVAQTPTLQAPGLQQMVEWCRQMMGQAGSMMQTMMSGTCMMGR